MVYSILPRVLLEVCLIIFLIIFLTSNAAAKPVDIKNIVIVSISDSINKPTVKSNHKARRGHKAGIKEVPRSKPHIKPLAVKTRIKIKPSIKRIKPVIKRPIGLIKRKLAF